MAIIQEIMQDALHEATLKGEKNSAGKSIRSSISPRRQRLKKSNDLKDIKKKIMKIEKSAPTEHNFCAQGEDLFNVSDRGKYNSSGPSDDIESGSNVGSWGETSTRSSTNSFSLPRHGPAKTPSTMQERALLKPVSTLHHFRQFVKEMMRFRALKISQLVLSIYIAILTFADMGPPGGIRDPDTGFIVDQNSQERTEKGLILVNGTERAIVATSTFQVGCIGIARLSAWFMYPGGFSDFCSRLFCFFVPKSHCSPSPQLLCLYLFQNFVLQRAFLQNLP